MFRWVIIAVSIAGMLSCPLLCGHAVLTHTHAPQTVWAEAWVESFHDSPACCEGSCPADPCCPPSGPPCDHCGPGCICQGATFPSKLENEQRANPSLTADLPAETILLVDGPASAGRLADGVCGASGEPVTGRAIRILFQSFLA